MKPLRSCCCILALLMLMLAPVRADVDVPLREEGELARLIMVGLGLITDDFLFLMHTDPDGRTPEQVAMALLDQAAALTDEEVSPEGLDPALVARLERHLDWRLTEYELRQSVRPDVRWLMRHVEENRDVFRRPRWIEGARMLVEPGPQQEQTVARLRAELEAGERSFAEIARAYYRSIGQDSDGDFGRRHEGEIAHELFDTFNAQEPSEPWFGPVEVTNGLMFGQLDAKGGTYFQPLSELRPVIERELVPERFEARREELLAHAEAERGLSFHLDPEAVDPADGNAVAYEIDGRAITVAELRALTPGIIVRPGAPGAEAALARHAAWGDVLKGARGEAFPADEELRTTLRRLLLHHARRAAARDAAWREADRSDEALRAFHEQRAELFREPGRIRLSAIAVPQNPAGSVIPRRMHEARTEAYVAFRPFAESLPHREDEDTGDWPGDALVLPTGAFIATPGRWLDVRELPASIAPRVAADDAPEREELVITDRSYLAWQVFEREEGRLPPFEEIRESVAAHHEYHTRLELLGPLAD